MNLRAEFEVTGFIDGPVAQRLLDEGKTADWFADYFAKELKALITEEVSSSEPDFSHHVNVHVTAKLHTDKVGEASTA